MGRHVITSEQARKMVDAMNIGRKNMTKDGRRKWGNSQTRLGKNHAAQNGSFTDVPIVGLSNDEKDTRLLEWIALTCYNQQMIDEEIRYWQARGALPNIEIVEIDKSEREDEVEWSHSPLVGM